MDALLQFVIVLQVFTVAVMLIVGFRYGFRRAGQLRGWAPLVIWSGFLAVVSGVVSFARPVPAVLAFAGVMVGLVLVALGVATFCAVRAGGRWS